jgi:hypothetical protein
MIMLNIDLVTCLGISKNTRYDAETSSAGQKLAKAWPLRSLSSLLSLMLSGKRLISIFMTL